MKNLLDSEKHILDLVKENPEILNDAEKRKEVAERVGLSEKTIRNRIGELRKRGFLDPGNDESHIEMESIDTDMPSVMFIASIWRSKYKIARNAFIIALLMVAYSLMLPKTFKASSVILISKEENSLL